MRFEEAVEQLMAAAIALDPKCTGMTISIPQSTYDELNKVFTPKSLPPEFQIPDVKIEQIVCTHGEVTIEVYNGN